MTVDIDIAILTIIEEKLEILLQQSPDSLNRVLNWINDKYGANVRSIPLGVINQNKQSSSQSPIRVIGNEIPGIARITENGEFILLCRDFKATSANDSAIRLVHVALLANELITGESTLSSRNVISPLLKKFRLYDGNTRVAIASHPGIIREKDQLSLDEYAKDEAEKFIKDILDDSITGKWDPSRRLTVNE